MINEFTIGLNGNWYEVTMNTATSGSASIDKSIGSNGMTATLSANPIQGATLSGWDVTGGSVQNNIFTFGNTDATITPVFMEYVAPSISGGWTYTTIGECRWTLDPAPGMSKQPNETTSAVNGDFVSSYDPSQISNDQFWIWSPSAGTWNTTFNNWQDYTGATYMRHDFGEDNPQNLQSIITIDFFGKENVGNCMNDSVTDLPSAASGIFNANNLTSMNRDGSDLFCNNLGTAFTGALIPFITAMESVATGLSDKACFNSANIPNASDLNDAVAQYPSWFYAEETTYEHTCNFCYTEFNGDYCPNCGEAYWDSPIETHICNFCGTDFEGDYCPNCGNAYWDSPE